MSFYSSSFGTPPFIGVPSAPGGNPYLPGGGPPILPGEGPNILSPGPGPQIPSMQMVPVMTPYMQGPYCFGLDNSICANLPETLHLGPSIAGVDIPAREICKAITNLTCAVVVVVFLVVILGVAVNGLISNA